MNRSLILLSVSLTLTVSAANAGDIDFSTGVFIVNEDWYGHQNSTVNYLQPDAADGNYWHYRVIQTENPGVELGCTSQYGAIWNGRFYLIAKQAKDPGASIQGGRITVADASTMKVLHQQSLIDPSGAACDGRGFCGVDEHKGYISTSNGVWIFDLDSFEVKGQIEGTANPTPKNLYRGQCGSMVMTAGRVFVAHQSLGLLVIDAATDRLIDIVELSCVDSGCGIGSVVLAKDGSLWLSVAKNTTGMGGTNPNLVRVDPVTLATEVVPVSDGFFPPSNSWYAWTPDAFCASTVNNVLYWAGGKNSWFSNQQIFRFDIDTHTLTNIIDLGADGENWKLYGCSMRVHPVTDEIYMSLYHEFNDQTYVTRRYSSSGSKLQEYAMIQNYWFPSLPVFPQSDAAGIDLPQAGVDVPLNADTEVAVYNLNGSLLFCGAYGCFNLAMRQTLPHGIYLLSTRAGTRKFVL